MELRGMVHSTPSTNLADLLERILDKGIVISGDIRINLVNVELLTIQIRLVICSVDRAQEMGMDWWRTPQLAGHGIEERQMLAMEQMQQRIELLESRLKADATQPILTPGVVA